MNNSVEPELDAQLRTAFAPPPESHFAALARQATGQPRRTMPWSMLLAAAALIIVVLTLAMEPRVAGPEGHSGQELGKLWAAAYQDAEQQGFGGPGCCMMGFDLAGTCNQRFACPLQVAMGKQTHIFGSYTGLSTGGAVTVLGRHRGMPVCVCILPRDQSPEITLPKDSGLQLARREVGNLVLYSLAKDASEAALEAFELR